MSEFENISEKQSVAVVIKEENLDIMSLAEILDVYNKLKNTTQGGKQYLVDRIGVILL